MSYADLDYNLTEEQRAMRDMVRRFGAEVMRPAGIELDRLADPEEVIAKGSRLWDVFKQFRQLGLHKRGFSKYFGGMLEDMVPMSGYLITEELGYADAGLTIGLGVSGMPFSICQLSSSPTLQALARDYVEDTEARLIGCWAITEPDHGSDWSLGGEDPKCGPSVRVYSKGINTSLTDKKPPGSLTALSPPMLLCTWGLILLKA